MSSGLVFVLQGGAFEERRTWFKVQRDRRGSSPDVCAACARGACAQPKAPTSVASLGSFEVPKGPGKNM